MKTPEELLPRADATSRHSIRIAAVPDVVYPVVRALDVSGSPLIRTLFLLRGLPRSSLRLEGLQRLGFKLLEDDPPHGFTLGLIGRFWTFRGHLVDFDPDGFRALEPPGHAKAVWSFRLHPSGHADTLLETETRVWCTDERARRSFKRYWLLVGPFSSLIRGRMLRLAKATAEEKAGPRAE